MKLQNVPILSLLFLCFPFFAQNSVSIIPYPNEVREGSGNFLLDNTTPIIFPNKKTEAEADYLATILENGFGSTPVIKSEGKGISLFLKPSLESELGDEGYKLTIETEGIKIEGATETGIFYGIQSLRQLLPADFELEPNPNSRHLLSSVEIVDSPRFQWRSFHLDESRHFKGMKEVKKLLDQMALLKMNKFHWHLTDDQGWRIEIKKYPKLTTVGSFRKDTQKNRGGDEMTGVPHGGFYTQDEIKEIIQYAQERHIQIVPEIEMPGHATAAIAAYPWLGSLGTTKEVAVTFGKLEDSFNISDPKVVAFLKDVLDEVMALFPGEVIHIGGDEVNFHTWKNSKAVKAFMEKEDLKSPVDLQIFFTNQISEYIDNAGKRMMGWNEIMGDVLHEELGADNGKVEQELSQSAIVHFWKGDMELINRTVEEGYDVVNSNHWDTYMDYTYEKIPLKKAYSFNPIPEGLDEEYHHKIIGLGCQMWSEYIPTVQQMDEQIFPRLAAYAEVGWTRTENKNFEVFRNSLKNLKDRWILAGINFYEQAD